MQNLLDGHTGFFRGTISGAKPEIKTNIHDMLEHGQQLKKYCLTQKACRGIHNAIINNSPKESSESFIRALRYVISLEDQNFEYIEISDYKDFKFYSLDARNRWKESDVSSTMCKQPGSKTDFVVMSDGDKHIIRRITPIEGERIQGFPDDWTQVPMAGKPAEACGYWPRYGSCGNSFPVPVIKWIGKRILLNFVN